MKIQGVFYRETKPFVILNGQSYAIGDHVGPAIVRAIDRTGVTLDVDGAMKILTIE
jgi:hypothetical protein